MRCGARCGPGGERAVDLRWRKRHARGRLESRLGGKGTHRKHAAHVRDVGCVPAQRLVERRRVLPSRREGVRCGPRCRPGGGRVWGGGMHAGKRPNSSRGVQGTRGAYREHVCHVCDAVCVEVQRLVERRRVLPSRRKGMRCGAGYIGGRVWGGGGASGHARGKDPAQDLGGRARAERT